MTRGCPPGVLCVSNGLVFSLLGMAIVALIALYFIAPPAQLVKTTSRISMPSTMDVALSPPPPPLPPTIVMGGDDRYTRAPQPLRDWMAPPEFPPRGGIASIPINIPTQGLPESFQSIGMIHVDSQMLLYMVVVQLDLPTGGTTIREQTHIILYPYHLRIRREPVWMMLVVMNSCQENMYI